MIREIMTKRFFLRKPCKTATDEDLDIARDLVETLESHREHCLGMAANMIGEHKRIIAVIDESGEILLMLNPEILSEEGSYEAEEGCLSLEGTRTTTRFQHIEVAWEDENLMAHEEVFTGVVAQAIQHEIDHCNGILI